MRLTNCTPTKSASGFTLIELMITVAIIAIIAAVALPSYQSAMIKNRRALAQTVLADVAQREQQYLLDNRAYSTSLTTLNVALPATVSNYYTVTITLGSATAPSFTVTASPIAGSAQATDGDLSLTNTGVKLPSNKW